jgi:hypothetical protein
MKVEFIEDKHGYKIDGRSVPSVTQIIKETVGSGWLADEWYLTRGRAIHACADYIAQDLDFSFDERLSGYVAAIKKFFSEVKPTATSVGRISEVVVASNLYSFAGTIDLICKIGSENVVVDYKHSIDLDRVPLQLGGYSVAALESLGIEVKKGIGVQIREDGTYSMTKPIDLRRPRSEFLALRTTYSIKERCKTLLSQSKEAVNE